MANGPLGGSLFWPPPAQPSVSVIFGNFHISLDKMVGAPLSLVYIVCVAALGNPPYDGGDSPRTAWTIYTDQRTMQALAQKKHNTGPNGGKSLGGLAPWLDC